MRGVGWIERPDGCVRAVARAYGCVCARVHGWAGVERGRRKRKVETTSTDQLFVYHVESFSANAILHIINTLVLVFTFCCGFLETFDVAI